MGVVVGVVNRGLQKFLWVCKAYGLGVWVNLRRNRLYAGEAGQNTPCAST